MGQSETSSDRPASRAPAFGSAFWALNSIEMFERLAFYTLRVMAPIYVMQADDPGGLHLTAAQKGFIWSWWAIFQSLLPIVTGGFADRYGYKRVMTFAITLMTLGHVCVAFMRDIPGVSNYWAFFAAIMVLATGTAFFKPSIQGSLAQNLTKDNSSMGWGIFYWVVNVGAFVGHYLPAVFLAEPHTNTAWRTLFLAGASFSALNFFVLLTFKDVPSGASKTESVWGVLKRTIVGFFEPRLITWLAIMSGFWLMMYQLWDLQPNCIADWTDSTSLVESLRWLPQPVFDALTEPTPRGLMVPQNVLLSLNALLIIAGVIPMAWVTRRMRTLSAMVIGMAFATIGILVAGWTMNVWILMFGILFFSLGEMTTGPKKSEYLALIAPPGKKGLYLGYVNIPVGVGVYLGSWMAGHLYGTWGEKAVLALKYLATKTTLAATTTTQAATSAAVTGSTAVIGAATTTQAATSAAAAAGGVWNGDVGTLEAFVGVTRPDAMLRLQELTGLNATDATTMLWNTYHPQYYVWIPFAAIGVICAIALAVFGQMAKRWKDMDA